MKMQFWISAVAVLDEKQVFGKFFDDIVTLFVNFLFFMRDFFSTVSPP